MQESFIPFAKVLDCPLVIPFQLTGAAQPIVVEADSSTSTAPRYMLK